MESSNTPENKRHLIMTSVLTGFGIGVGTFVVSILLFFILGWLSILVLGVMGDAAASFILFVWPFILGGLVAIIVGIRSGRNKYKNLLNTFIPIPEQTILGLDPIVVQAIEKIFPNQENQKEVFEYFLRGGIDKNTFYLLARLCMSNGELEKLKGISTKALYEFTSNPNFSTMKDAENWVKSISKPKS